MRQANRSKKELHFIGPAITIIDGYNVIFNSGFQAFSKKETLETSRNHLLNLTINWFQNIKSDISIKQIIIVYDNTKEPDIPLPLQSKMGIIKVVFTKGEEADTWIIKHINTSYENKYLIVTEDTAIKSKIDHPQCKFIKPGDFLIRAKGSHKKTSRKRKTPEPSEKEIPLNDKISIYEELSKLWLTDEE